MSSELTETVSTSAVLQAICSKISQGLDRVVVQLCAEGSDRVSRSRAAMAGDLSA